MEKSQAIEKFHAFLKCWRYPEALELMTEDFVWENYMPAHVPFGGRYQGADGLQLYRQRLADSWVTGEFIFDKYIFEPEERALIVIGIERSGKSTITEREVFDLAFVFEIRFAEDGRLTFLREYNDTAVVGAAFDP